MLVIHLSFPAGKYHATPWDHHVNEGLVEWPPSPWRLCRALISLFRRNGDPEDEQGLRRLVKILGQPPRYCVPAFTTAHTRHYMPDFRSGTDKIFDTFHVIDPDARMDMIWNNAVLSPEERTLLDTLLAKMNYLGRSESWVTASASENASSDMVNVKPLDEWTDQQNPEPVWIMMPVDETEYSAWHSRQLVKKTIKKSELPEDVFGAMDQGTDWLKKQRLSRNPGSRMMAYGAVWPKQKQQVKPAAQFAPDMMVYQITSSVRPGIEQTLLIGERMRIALMSRSKDDTGFVPEIYSGKNTDGRHLKHGHQHAHFLPVDLDMDGVLDHLIVWSPSALTDRAAVAAGTLSSLWGEGGHTLYLGIQFCGQRSMLPDHPVTGCHRIWVSATPYFRARYPKFYRRKDEFGRPVPKLNADGIQTDGPEDLILAELKQRGFPAPEIQITGDMIQLHGRTVSAGRFKSRRKSGKSRAELPGLAIRLEFPEPVWGPVVLGYGAHFGLGLFNGCDVQDDFA
jgi:CRISPR-associated protein Csb2